MSNKTDESGSVKNSSNNLLKQGKALCVRCHKIKKIKEFYKRRVNGKPFSYCIQCQEEVKKLKFEEKMEIIVQMFGGICQDCGIPYPTPVYEFYADGKTFSVGRAKNMSLQRLMKELEGYVMLCKNCSALRKWEKG